MGASLNFYLARRALVAGLCIACCAAFAEERAQSLAEVDIVERLGDRVPLELEFRNSDDRVVHLRELIDGQKPVVMTLVYFRCPMLCGQVLSGLVRGLRDSGLKLGGDYRAVTVSFDPTEKPQDVAPHRRQYLQALGESSTNEGWQFLTGTETNIQALTDAVGFRSFYDRSIQQYAHVAAIFILSPKGKITRYLYGLDFPARDLRLGLVEASEGRVGTALDRVLLTCYRYDPASRRYAFFVSTFLRTGGLLVFGALFTALAIFWRKEIKRGQIV